MPRVRIYAWNSRQTWLPPRLARTRVTRWVPGGRTINNFGDLLGPLVVSRVLAERGLTERPGRRDCTLFSIGSVLHNAHDGDVVWGTGVNGKMAMDLYVFDSLDVRAVRGPLTRRFLNERGIEVPEVFGDPALLLPRLAPDLFSQPKASEVTIVPNFNDLSRYAADERILDPRLPVEVCLARIAGSKFVTGSSLHGIVVAESLGIPARLVTSAVEHPLKYEDYYLGTGRVGVEAAASVEEAIAAGGREPPRFDAEALLDAFPLDLWNAD